ncbi:MAG: hypothetical protein P4L92_10295 [Rudaea sp.]|nr:hypothetical protein [Rudaea sp.]
MNHLTQFFLWLLLVCPLAASAQQGDVAATASNTSGSAPADAAQFDFLLGQWALEVRPKVNSLVAMIHGTPRLVGTWKAWRAADGLGVEDEVRIFDASGNPISLNKSHRSYIGSGGLWKISGLDASHSRTSEATGKWLDGEMHLDGRFTDADGQPTLTRTRYYGITADGFHMQQDRSIDNGQSWDEAALTIDARRAAATATP